MTIEDSQSVNSIVSNNFIIQYCDIMRNNKNRNDIIRTAKLRHAGR